MAAPPGWYGMYALMLYTFPRSETHPFAAVQCGPRSSGVRRSERGAPRRLARSFAARFRRSQSGRPKPGDTTYLPRGLAGGPSDAREGTGTGTEGGGRVSQYGRCSTSGEERRGGAPKETEGEEPDGGGREADMDTDETEVDAPQQEGREARPETREGGCFHAFLLVVLAFLTLAAGCIGKRDERVL